MFGFYYYGYWLDYDMFLHFPGKCDTIKASKPEKEAFSVPMIHTRVNIPIPKETEEKLARRLGEAIKLLGKSEDWLMLHFDEKCKLYFRGINDSPLAYVEVKILGSAGTDAYAFMTQEICHILKEELAIPPECVYVYYDETDDWGWNGSNF